MDHRYVKEVTNVVNQNLEGFLYLSKFGDSTSQSWAKVFLLIAGERIEGVNLWRVEK